MSWVCVTSRRDVAMGRTGDADLRTDDGWLRVLDLDEL